MKADIWMFLSGHFQHVLVEIQTLHLIMLAQGADVQASPAGNIQEKIPGRMLVLLNECVNFSGLSSIIFARIQVDGFV
jgi:hypothetical protein